MQFQNFKTVNINELILDKVENRDDLDIQYPLLSFLDSNNPQKYVQRTVTLGNLQLNNFAYSYRDSGLIFAQNLFSFRSLTLSLQINNPLQTLAGALYTLQNIEQVLIQNSNIQIGEKGVISVQFGGLIYLNQVNSAEIKQFYFQNEANPKLIFQVQQGGIIYSDSQNGNIVLNQIQANNLKIQGDGGFAYLQQSRIEINDFQINNFNVQNNGGVFFFDQISNSKNRQSIQVHQLSMVNCTSQLTGGAIYGGSFSQLSEVTVKYCSSKFGGGFYSSDINKNQLMNIQFDQNKALLYGQDFCKGITNVTISKVYQYNYNLGEKLNLIEIFKWDFNELDVFNGLDYVIVFSIQIEDKVIDILNSQQTENDANNFSTFATAKLEASEQKFSENLLLNLVNNPQFSSFFIILKMMTMNNLQRQLTVNVNFINSTNWKDNFQLKFKTQFQFKCFEGAVLKTFRSTQYCEYCYDSVQIQIEPTLNTTCQQCSKDYFEECYGQYSLIKPGYWRNQLDVNSSLIQKCSEKPQNCLGGYSYGNKLCAKGHIGVECLGCDLYNVNGQGYFSNTNIYSCTDCNTISFNFGKIIILLVILLILIFTVFKTNFKQQKNYIYKRYLSDMKIIYFGNSYYRLGQSGSYIRILSFYFQIMNIASYFYGSETWKQLFNFQQNLYNPVMGSSISIDCFFLDIFLDDQSYHISYFYKIYVITLSPFAIVIASVLPSLLMVLLKKSTWKKFSYAASLILSYSFTTLFCVPVVDLLVSGIFCKTFSKGQQFAILDLTLECQDPDRIQFVSSFILPFLILYSTLIPGFIFIALIKNRFRLEKIHVRFLLGFIYSDYKAKYFYWEFIRLCVRYILIAVLYSFYSSTSLIGYFSLAILILYSNLLNKFKPYVSERLNKMEQLSITIGGLFLIGYMIKFSLGQNSNNENQALASHI